MPGGGVGGGLDQKVLEIIIDAKNQTAEGIAGASGALTGFEAHLLSVGKHLALIGGGMTIAGAAIAAGIGIVVDKAATFEETTTALVTGAGEQESALGGIQKGLLDLAGQVGVNATDLAKGLYMIESAGFHGADGLVVLQASAEGAKIGMADQAVVADALTTIMKDYHLPASAAIGVTGQMTAAVAAGKMHWEDFAGSLSKVLPIAAGLNIPFQDVAAAVAVMTAHGVDAARAATAIQSGLMQLVHPSKAAQAAIHDLGIPLDQLQAKLSSGDLYGALDMFSQAMQAKLPESARAALAAAQDEMAHGVDPSQIFAELESKVGPAYSKVLSDIVASFGGVRGGALALNLLPNMDEYKADIESIGTVSQGAAKEQAAWALVETTAADKFSDLTAAINATEVSLGLKLLPVLKELMDKARPLVEQIRAWVDAHSDLVAKVLLGVAAFLLIVGPILMFLGILAMAAAGFAVLVAMINPVTIIIVVLIAIVAALSAAWLTNFGGIREFVTAALKQVGDAITTVIAFLGTLPGTFATVVASVEAFVAGVKAAWANAVASVEAFVAGVKTAWANAVATVQTTWATIVGAVQGAIDSVISTVQTGWATVTGAVATAMGTAKAGLIAAWAAITGSVASAISTVRSVVEAGIAAVPVLIHAAMDLVVGAFQWMYDHNYYFQDLVDFIRTAWTTITTDATTAWDAVTSWLTGAWQTISTTATTVYTAISTFLSTTWAAVKSDAIAVWTAISTFLTTTWTAISTAATTVYTAISTFLSTTWAAVKSDAIAVWTAISTFLTTTWTAISTTISATLTAIQDTIITPAWTAIRSVATTIWTAISTLITTVWADITSGIGAAAPKVEGAAKSIWDTIRDGVTGLVNSAVSWGANIVQGIIDGLLSKLQAIKDAAAQVAGAAASALGFHSPTEYGPGRDADTWGPNLVTMFAQGMVGQAPIVQQASATIAGAAGMSVAGPTTSTAVVPLGRGGAGAGGNTFHLHLTGTTIMQRDDVDDVVDWFATALEAKFRLSTQH